MISKQTAVKVLNEALLTGADFAEIYIEEDNQSAISLDNGKVESSSDTLTYGAGIRLLKDLQSVYGYTNDVSQKGLIKLAQELRVRFNGERLITVNKVVTQKTTRRNQPKIRYDEYPREDLIRLLEEASLECLNYDEKIVRCVTNFTCNYKTVKIFNSEEKEFNDVHSRGRVMMYATAKNDHAIESFRNGPGAQKGMEFFLEDIDLKEVARDTARSALTMLEAEECPSGKMTVIIGNGFGGVIFHEAVGHSLEASAVSKGLSVFSGKKGQRIASELVSAVDDGTIDGGWGSGNVDDEGNPTHCNVLLKDGILTSYLVDNFNGRRMGEKGNGACRRESYKYEPTSRMSNTFILNGKSTVEEIIANTEYGLYAKSMGGGSVNPPTGEFNFAVNEGYIIKNGKIAYPVKGATLIGSGKDVLLNVDMVGNDLKRGQGMCGAASGSIPADVGEPTIRVQNVTVGGRGGVVNG